MDFISRCLEVFGFGADFRKWVSILNTDVSSCVGNNGLHSDFLASRGVFDKEIPYHPYIFITAIAIRTDDNIRGIYLGTVKLNCYNMQMIPLEY